jgi:predicted adenylyl cyclase CyaB
MINIEIKARARDFGRAIQLAEKISDTKVELLCQEDTFFNTPAGRLKLRVFGPRSGELIYYVREDSKEATRSDYVITKTADPEGLKETLSLALGVRGVVRKRRLLYRSGPTRIHLDDVEGLGHFIELEYVMTAGEGFEQASKAVQELMHGLEIKDRDLVSHAYIDLLAPSGRV